MKLNRKLVLVLALVLSLALASGGTLAYLTDTDKDVNVMTLGNVKIVQNEQERDENGNLQPFTPNKPAYPAVGPVEWADEGVTLNGVEYQVFTDELKNVIDKIVTVTNTGKSPAYVRTIIAIEAPDYDPNDLIHVNVNANGVSNTPWTPVDLGDTQYVYSVFTYEAALEPGKTSAPSLMQLFLDAEATNEDVAKFGDTWEVLVVSQAAQTAGFDNAETALNTAFAVVDAKAVQEWFGNWADWESNGEISSPSEIPYPDGWPSNNPPVVIEVTDGPIWQELPGVDTSWYDEDKTEFVINTPYQLAGLGLLVEEGKTFDGKTVKLGADIDLLAVNNKGERILFDPIGSYRFEQVFQGTFDGQGHTISGMSQNTWALNNGYYYGDCGMGLFACIEDATIKNVTVDGAEISGESALCGTVAATAFGDCTFENITIKNTNVADYQYYAGGVVGWASGNHEYIGINVDESVVVGGQWGDFNNANGGIIGGIDSDGTYTLKDCTVACRIDAVNDVVSAYEWYSYRRCGMLIGDSGSTTTDEAVTYAAAPNLICEDVTVIYGDWANYTYCKFSNMRYPFVRVQAGTSVGAYTNIRYGHPTDANGNTVVDDNHTHNDGDAHQELIAFDQLYGGKSGHRYCTYGTATHTGVTVIYNNK